MESGRSALYMNREEQQDIVPRKEEDCRRSEWDKVTLEKNFVQRINDDLYFSDFVNA
jgi:hypothetical protein